MSIVLIACNCAIDKGFEKYILRIWPIPHTGLYNGGYHDATVDIIDGRAYLTTPGGHILVLREENISHIHVIEVKDETE